jgi:hypothetical protein
VKRVERPVSSCQDLDTGARGVLDWMPPLRDKARKWKWMLRIRIFLQLWHCACTKDVERFTKGGREHASSYLRGSGRIVLGGRSRKVSEGALRTRKGWGAPSWAIGAGSSLMGRVERPR